MVDNVFFLILFHGPYHYTHTDRYVLCIYIYIYVVIVIIIFDFIVLMVLKTMGVWWYWRMINSKNRAA